MKRAMGMVAATVKSPQGLSASALTTTNPSTAMRITMMQRIPKRAILTAKVPTSSLTICPNDFPPRLMEQNRATAS